ncbi:Uma2 family endonuclease [Anabaena sp. FACHB-709]|uniref:Uma2 family endonuclease n=2 Tax=Nostocaceae TaxID=1162 RepID=A0ABR7ZE72_ANACY|nr:MULTISPECIES: Uma2 family endonuclease [Nostocaceae]MBD2170950.1 Uma2 family endonuclease [Anabaena cylindrica FACHB-318]MBD2262732.1 Uma2 family endonuclease [Anabaena sp. FACHB-709]MBD2272471.1 Uma2 family endonuclease [Nostoc sp. PCC 7120 = FACHB-418]MBD2283329.1 Uma2 family endonuclease [Anabaena cylindrica FACHB-170]MBD2348238.1 Uma2 family endonuclease [Trichormus variabilis FACHB-171]
MLNYNPLHCLPSSEELPNSDDTPVDNELQDLIPSLLKSTLALVWSDRWDWYFGVNMGIYYDPNKPAIVPDGFLSIEVKRFIDGDLRLSYVLWEEQKPPVLVVEVASPKHLGEYSSKKELYAQELGILYYVVYNPFRRKKSPLEVYQLEDGEYVLMSGDPIWLPEIGLGIGRERGIYQGIAREWLYWYNEKGERLLTPEERILDAEQRANFEAQRRLEAEEQVHILTERLKSLGFEPETMAGN